MSTKQERKIIYSKIIPLLEKGNNKEAINILKKTFKTPTNLNIKSYMVYTLNKNNEINSFLIQTRDFKYPKNFREYVKNPENYKKIKIKINPYYPINRYDQNIFKNEDYLSDKELMEWENLSKK